MACGSWQQPPCPLSFAPAPPHLPVGIGGDPSQLYPASGAAGKGVVMGSGHCPAGTRSAISQHLPRGARTLGQGGQGDANAYLSEQTQCVGVGAFIHMADLAL